MDWRHRAACRDGDPNLHFPVGNSGPALLQIAEAKTVCRRCPAVAACLAYALDEGIDSGVFGGMSEDERRALRRRNARARQCAQSPKEVGASSVEPAEWAAPASTLEKRRGGIRHVVNPAGRALCNAHVLNLGSRVHAGEVSVGQRCAQPRCRRAYEALDRAMGVAR